MRGLRTCGICEYTRRDYNAFSQLADKWLCYVMLSITVVCSLYKRNIMTVILL